jgi:hypothetical protein
MGKITREQAFNNFTMMQALDEVDHKLAVEAISDPNLDGDELSSLLTTSLMGNVVNKETGEPAKLSNEVVVAGMLNRMIQLAKKSDLEI